MAVFLRRLLRVGKLPGELRDELEAEGVVFLAEYVPVTRRFSGRIPGRRSSGSVVSYVGSVAFTSQRALTTLSIVPKLAARTLDVRWDDPRRGAVKAEISGAGVTMNLDVSEVDPRFSGQLSLRYKTAIPDSVLAGLPKTHLEFDVPAEYVFRAVGVAYQP